MGRHENVCLYNDISPGNPRSLGLVSFCLLSGVSSGCARPVAGPVIEPVGYWSDLFCDWLGTAWGCSRQEVEDGPWCDRLSSLCDWDWTAPSQFSGDDLLLTARPVHHCGPGVPIQVLRLPGQVPSKGVNRPFVANTKQTRAGMTRPNYICICMLLIKTFLYTRLCHIRVQPFRILFFYQRVHEPLSISVFTYVPKI